MLASSSAGFSALTPSRDKCGPDELLRGRPEAATIVRFAGSVLGDWFASLTAERSTSIRLRPTKAELGCGARLSGREFDASATTPCRLAQGGPNAGSS